MLHDPFLKVGLVDVDAFVLGIGRMRWKSAKPHWNENKAFNVMQEYEFDVLPIESKDQPIVEYFMRNSSTKSCERVEITDKDLLPAEIHAIDLIEKFASKDRKFFFLTSGNEIEGLITISELNTPHMKLAICALIAELETSLGQFIKDNNISDEVIKKYLKKGTKEYNKDKSGNIERHIIEYVNFVDLFDVLESKQLFIKLGYQKIEKFKDLKVALNDLRTHVAHPVKSLVAKEKPVSKLWEKIVLTRDLLSRLQEHQVQGGK